MAPVVSAVGRAFGAPSFSWRVAEEPQSPSSSWVISERGMRRGGKHGPRARVSVGRVGRLGGIALCWPCESRSRRQSGAGSPWCARYTGRAGCRTRRPDLRPERSDPDAPDPLENISLAKPEVEVNPQAADEGLLAQDCVDQYLWLVYDRAPKVDTNKLKEWIKATVKSKGKTRTVIKTVIRLVDGDFTWKDPKAAERAGMSLKDYVIGGMDRAFKGRLYRLFRALDEAGLAPGMTSGFRDDYRQSIATGNKAASDSSYHGGSR